MGKAKILIVEDESIVALNIQNRLEELGYKVTAKASTGEAALQAVGNNCPDLVLMDIKLTGKLDGIEAADQIRQQFQIPVVYLTAYTDEETLSRAKLTEPYGYILKPFESRDLCTSIEVALYKYQVEQQLRERERWLATTLKSIGDAVITTDPQGLVTFMNPVAEGLTQWKQREALGHDLSQVFQAINEKTRKAVENPISIALQKGIVVGIDNHTLLITKEGNEIPISDSAAPIKNEDGNVLGAVLVFQNVTEQKQIEALLQKANDELELRVEESTIQLRKTNEQLKAEIVQRQRLEDKLLVTLEQERELNELKSRIITTVSHEYRTPLTTILSSTELLRQYDARLTPEKKQQHFQRIQSSVQYLTEMVNDMLFVSEAEAGNLEFSPSLVDVVQVIGELIAEFQPDATDCRIIFECKDTSVNAILDEIILQSILKNLLSNAIKYSPQGSQVYVKLSGEPNQISFQVVDSGIGIPQAEQAQLFNAFFRGSNVSTIPGVGLGLVIVKKCVDLHGGEITVESEEGVGTTFTVTLPTIDLSIKNG